jgi:hypothetical protein
MNKVEELLSHAARCNRLAEVCLDRTVAEKFRHLARDYWELAGQPSELERIETWSSFSQVVNSYSSGWGNLSSRYSGRSIRNRVL